MKDTITESELNAMRDEWLRTPDIGLKAVIRFILSEVGITVVPDPIPEPEGDVIVVDGDGRKWAKDHGPQLWTTSGRDSVLVGDWHHLTSRGPVKIYRLEESNA